MKENKFLIYRAEDKDVGISVIFRDEMIWATQKVLAELFGVQRPAITKHLNNIFERGELDEKRVCSKMEHTAEDGKRYVSNFYNLDAIISVGYRVNSEKATRFRIWATGVLRNFMIKGFALDKERLKNGAHFGKDYFEDLLGEIREIRASERRFYQKITDIYATAVDYDSGSVVTRDFFASIQNKLHFAIHGKTASELIVARAGRDKENMGLKTWRGAPDGKILRRDVGVAKNYLSGDELEALERIVFMYLDYAEDQAEKSVVMTMEDWVERLDRFLAFNEREVLGDFGKVSAEVARGFAEGEFVRFRVLQDEVYLSDFDLEMERILGEEEIE